MIVDSFDYIACYKGLHPNLDTAIEWLNSHTLDALENGKTIIDGDKVFVNVMDADQLRQAQREPEKFRDLQVRICGWNVLWNSLSRKEQDAYIQQAER